MDCVEVKGESPVEEQLEPLLILEEGDEPDGFTNNTARGKGVLRVKRADEAVEGDGGVEESGDTEAEVEDGKSEREAAEVNEAEEEKQRGQQTVALENESGEAARASGTDENAKDSEVETVPARAEMAIVEKATGDEMEGPLLEMDVVAKERPHLAPDVQSPAKLRPRDLLRPEDAQQKLHRLSTDFPDTLYELLCTLQEGRRLNDQRCSFRLEGRRRCYSEPSTPRHSLKVTFSSMTSLQKEEFFDFLANSQGRRLDDQRANFQSLSPVPSSPESQQPSSAPTNDACAVPEAKAKPRKGSCKAPEATRTVSRPAPKEDLYNMILTSQAQGRLEEQRSVAPGPMDDEDFFSLLLKVQGGRMDEQRTELPLALKY